MRFNFPKTARLSSKTELDKVFRSKQKFVAYPLRFQWLTTSNENTKVVIGCPKRNLKLAVDRNLVKRRMKEAYRTSITELKENVALANTGINIAIIFIGNETTAFDVIQTKMIAGLEHIKTELEGNE